MTQSALLSFPLLQPHPVFPAWHFASQLLWRPVHDHHHRAEAAPTWPRHLAHCAGASGVVPEWGCANASAFSEQQLLNFKMTRGALGWVL